MAKELAAHFNKISSEFRPLEPHEIPRTFRCPLRLLQPHDVAGRIRHFRKPKSMVRGDVFPQLVTELADFFAIPLTSIYNEISITKVWPAIWKEEYVTVIPKKANPTNINDLRNISCTMLASKMYESYVLEWLQKQVKVKNNQFGGVKGRSADHMLVSIWDKILTDLEDCRAGSVLTSIDYAKAFNRLSFQECLAAFARKGASSDLIAVLASFLSNRTMSVRIEQTWSPPLPVCGGVPQGSILGVFLFNVTTDDLEEGSGVDDQSDLPELVEDPSLDHSPDFREAPTSSLGVTTSTPEAEGAAPESPCSPVLPPGYYPNETFYFLPNARNTHRFRARRILYSSEGEISLPPEPNPVTSAKWSHTRPLSVRYVDDGCTVDKENFETAEQFAALGGERAGWPCQACRQVPECLQAGSQEGRGNRHES